MYDGMNSPSSAYNLCIKGAFCANFWASTKSGLNDLDKISPGYQERWRFIRTLRTYLTHIKRMLYASPCFSTLHPPSCIQEPFCKK